MNDALKKFRILLVDDDPQALSSTRRILEYAGFEVTPAEDGLKALELARSGMPFDAVVTDVRMPRMGGIEFLRAMKIYLRKLPVILMTAYGSVEDAVWAMKLGAVDFLTKPFKRKQLLDAVRSALKSSGATSEPNAAFIADSDLMKALAEKIDQIAATQATVLVEGESGTGKEVVARQIHEKSSRSKGPFVALNCAAIPEALMESELFGHEKGAFSGATQAKKGLMETAHHGTLFLDEIGDMPLALQAKLLRVIQEGEIRRVGATRAREVDVRIVSATHRNLKERVAEGHFRQDLLFRLDVVQVQIPPLRNRRADIQPLALYFLKQAADRHGKSVSSIQPEALSLLEQHAWPGNVRELCNMMERAVVFAVDQEIRVTDLPAHLQSVQDSGVVQLDDQSVQVPLGTPLKDVEDLLIRKTLEATDGNKTMTAKILGINSRTIYRKLEKDR